MASSRPPKSGPPCRLLLHSAAPLSLSGLGGTADSRAHDGLPPPPHFGPSAQRGRRSLPLLARMERASAVLAFWRRLLHCNTTKYRAAKELSIRLRVWVERSSATSHDSDVILCKIHRCLEATRPSVYEMYEVGSSGGGGRERNKREREKEERGKRRELSARAFAIARSAHVGSVRPSVGRAGGRRVSRGLPPLFLSLHVARSFARRAIFIQRRRS